MSVGKDCKPEIKLDPILSNRYGGVHGWDRSAHGGQPPPPLPPMPPGVPVDPRYEEALRTRRRMTRLHAWALGASIAGALFAALFIASSLQNRRLMAEADEAQRATCAALALGLQGADNGLGRARDGLELQRMLGTMSVAIHPILARCMPPAEADALSQQIAEARSPEQAAALMKSARDRLRN